ncbi:hypothetical protein DYY67_0357 [Candidatus Nitrosotalea sp. TS]|uniref:SMP-30/gluconolactonase/LRE family protein n=1 Tax=Candidatus Nitrosotalea sp. TS TaxID=2341020 RepID=UPI00140E8C8D|nr:SMP-30/gluconolactonase/LRE family protein [Candidatus Nitrosotalea sp. TS]NHI04599.1 hypothetical protein [Candidatus Nitrosotalea sp. TS]
MLVLDSLINMFKSYPLDQNPSNLPYGMTLDADGHLWIAQHTYDKVAVVDPSTGQYVQIDIPSKNSFTQWLVATDKGVVIAEQRAHALGLITSSVNSAESANSAGNLVAPIIPVSPLKLCGICRSIDCSIRCCILVFLHQNSNRSYKQHTGCEKIRLLPYWFAFACRTTKYFI